MNLDTGERIAHHEMRVDGENEPMGMWLEPADMIREMLMVAGGPPHGMYHINLIGVGRCFGNSRNTTFFALRIVYLDGYSSTRLYGPWPYVIAQRRGEPCGT